MEGKNGEFLKFNNYSWFSAYLLNTVQEILASAIR